MAHGICRLVLVALLAAAATAKPHSGLELSSALNKTLCPTVVKYNVNANRIPRVIKTLECDEKAEGMCAAGARSAQCCRLQRADRLLLACAQLTDRVLVSTRDLARTYSITVPVGCSCIAHETTRARDAR